MLNKNQIKCINLMITDNKTQKQIAKEINITEKTIKRLFGFLIVFIGLYVHFL